MEQFVLKKAYQDIDILRQSFNQLAGEIFGLDFEDWYVNGFWGDTYIPYSYFEKDKIIANVSVSLMEFVHCREKKLFIQLGTVMTAEAYRNRGLIRRLIEEIFKDYENKADGFFLFANDSVLEFYPKFGFQKMEEYQYSKCVNIRGEKTAKEVPMQNPHDFGILKEAVLKEVCNGAFEMVKNPAMILFYVSKFMKENVYYVPCQEAYVIAEWEEEKRALFIHTIIAKQQVDLDAIIKAFGNVSKVTLGFTPVEKEGYTVSKICEDDTTLFIKGDWLLEVSGEYIMFPTLCHA